MALPVSFPFVGTPAFFTGTGESTLVPEVFPVAINGRPYVVDIKSGRYTRQFDARVRDSQDSSTSPGEAAINPQGLWRRGQTSWHYGAGQKYADVADSQDYRFYASKGVNPWTKGQLTLLNATTLSLSSAATNLMTCVAGGRFYVADGANLKFTTDFSTWTTCDPPSTPWTDTIKCITTDGSTVFVGYTTQTGVYQQSATSSSPHAITSYVAGDNWYFLSHAKNRLFGAHSGSAGGTSPKSLHWIDVTGKNELIEPPNTGLTWVGVAAGQNAAYAATNAGSKAYIYKITLNATSSSLDTPIISGELPIGETISSIFGYLGFIFLGTSKGVRFCIPDGNNNLTIGSVIPTTNPVLGFTADDKYVWFTYTNYDGTSTGLGRMDLSVFTSTAVPAYATDLMYTSTAAVNSCNSLAGKRAFTVSGVGVVVEDTANVVASGDIEVGTYRWGIPDRKFAPRVDLRVQPLVGSVQALVAADNGSYVSIGSHTDEGETEHTFIASESKFIEAAYKFVINRSTGTYGPTVTRWMSRAYAAPVRSRLITVPILLHKRHNINSKDYYFDVALERDLLEELAADPQIVSYQEKDDTFTVIVEDCQWQPYASSGTDWLWEGTMTVIMRTITE